MSRGRPTARTRVSRALSLALGALLLPASGWAAAVTSAQDGPWSLTATWTGGVVPADSDTVTIQAGHTVTVDITTATASTTTINGHLYFSRTASSSFTVVGGSISVNAGGWLNLGTEADVIQVGINAHLVLAKGSGDTRYGLTVFDGGDFTVRGATKTPYGYATETIGEGATTLKVALASTENWGEGDVITIGPTDRNVNGTGPSSVWEATITDVSGADPNVITFLPAIDTARVFTASAPIIVANLTRNVLVRSSGTDTTGTGDTAFITDLVQNATSFSLVYGEFAHIGADIGGGLGDKRGVGFQGSGSRGEASSSTFRNGYRGIYLRDSSGNTLSANNFYANPGAGVRLLGSSNNTFSANNSFANPSAGFFADDFCNGNTFSANNSYANSSAGLYFENSSRNTLSANNSYANGNFGIQLNSSSNDNTLSANNSYANSSRGIYLVNSSRNTLSANNLFSNASHGLFVDGGAINNSFIGGNLGYDAQGNPAPNSAEVGFDPDASAKSLILRQARVNPTNGINTAGFNDSGSYLLSYDQDYDTGTVRLWGDYALSGSTWTFQHDVRVSTSLFTAPKSMRLAAGSSHSASVCSTDDASAVNQLIAIERVAGVWQVSGSVSGNLGTITPGGSCPGTDFGQFRLVLTEGDTPTDGDKLDFILIAASPIQNIQKRLLFGPADSTFNSGKSRLTVAPTGGIVFRGQEGEHALIDRLDSGSTYYTFVDSGAFTAHFSSFTNMDFDGIQLSGSAGIAISSSTFDFLGLAGTENAYITARALNSNATFYSVTFDDSRASVGVSSANVRVEGADADLFWRFITQGGGLWGEDFDDDANNKVRWGGDPPENPVIAAVHLSSIAVAWGSVTSDGYVLEASSTNFGGGVIHSSATANSASTGLTVEGLDLNTTYYLRAGALHGQATSYFPTTPVSTPTLAAMPDLETPVFPGVFHSSLTVQWSSGSAASGFNPSGTLYQVEVSTASPGFFPVADSSGTRNRSADLGGLLSGTTYYARVRAINHGGTSSGYRILGSTITLPAAPVGASHVSVDSRTLTLSWSANLNGPTVRYEVSQSTDLFALNFSTPVAFSNNLTALTTTFLGLTPNTTYTHRLRAQDAALRVSSFSAAATTVTLAAEPLPLPFTNVTASAFTANWDPLDNPSDTLYVVEVSTFVDFSQILDTSATLNGFATFGGLESDKVHYVRLRAFNHAGIPTAYVLIGAVQTAVGVVTLSADQLTSVYNRKTIVRFSAQGAQHYHYRYTAVANETPLGTDPSFDGTLFPVAVPEGEGYFHVLGHDGSHAEIGVAHYGPVWVDRSSPTVASISAQISAADATPILSGQATAASNPRFTWPAPGSFAPVIGYSYALVTDLGTDPALTANTTLTFQDETIPGAGTYYFKVRALDQAGNWGNPASFTYILVSVSGLPTAFTPLGNVFNPKLGQQMTLSYSLSGAGRVSVKLYTLQGRLVKVLVDQDQAPGTYNVPWRGVNEAGETVASGTYLLVIEAPGFKEVMKAAVIK